MTVHDVIVVGAGPAGANAALEAAARGLDVMLVDEQPDAGGQVWRAKAPAILSAPQTAETRSGDALRRAVAEASMHRRFHTRAWQIERDGEPGWRVALVGPNGPEAVRARALVLAAGAQERVVPFPGWTLPGVIGLAGSTAMMKRDLLVPGDGAVIAGCGPLVMFVAAETLRLGGRPAAVVSLNGRADWMQSLPAMLSRPAMLARGLGWLARLAAARVPVFWRHGVTAAHGEDALESVEIAPVDRDWAPRPDGLRRRIACEALCIGHGLMPATEAARLAGAELRFEPALGGWATVVDEWGKASNTPDLWVCGDGAAVHGEAAASLQGKATGIAVSEALGGRSGTAAGARSGMASRLAAARRFGLAMGRLTVPRAGLLETIAPDTTLCRCEGVTRADLEAELNAGAESPNALKSGTRLGMGACGGRFCSDVAAMLTASATGRTREQIGLATARPPLRPVAIAALADEIDYDALPIPGPAPL